MLSKTPDRPMGAKQLFSLATYNTASRIALVSLLVVLAL